MTRLRLPISGFYHLAMLSLPIIFILNPAAARGRALTAWQRAQHALDGAGVPWTLERTEAPGHAIEMAERAARLANARAVVAVGGDGTVHEVANGLLRGSDGEPTLPLGIVPVGSGNDFAKLLGVPRDPAAAVRHLLAAEPRAVDVGRVGERFFTNGVGVGFDARVAIEARSVRRLRGMAVYGWALLRVLRSHRSHRMRVVLDEREIELRPLTLVTVGNGGCHGGGFWICPAAKIDDGWLDVCIADAITRAGVLRLIPHVLRGTHIGRKEVRMERARQVRITSPDPLPVHADGEILAEAAHEVEIGILPGRLRVLA